MKPMTKLRSQLTDLEESTKRYREHNDRLEASLRSQGLIRRDSFPPPFPKALINAPVETKKVTW